MSTERVIKWGILGPGWIASMFISDLKTVEGAEAVAVGSRTLANAEKFAAEYGIAKAYGSYEALAEDTEVDIVYVATPHPFHKENVMTCLRAGKAVLCEKPFTVNAVESEEIIQYAREKRLFLMEAMWTRYLPAIHQVRQWLEQGSIGDVRMMKADFGFRSNFNPKHRLFNPDLAGGALLDVGIYPVSFASMVFGGAPESISASAQLGETGVDEQFSLLFTYSGGRTASLNGAVRLTMDNNCYIYGTEGKIEIPSFINAQSATLHVYGADEVKFQYDGDRKGFAYEAIEAGRCLREGLTESVTMPLDESLELMRTLDAIRAQWGLKYPFEG